MDRTNGEEHREPLFLSRVHIINLPVQLLYCNDTAHRSLSLFVDQGEKKVFLSLSLSLSE